MAHNQQQQQPVGWGGTLTMPREWESLNATAGQQQHTPWGPGSMAMSNTARDSLLQVGNAARDRRMSERGLRNSDTPQDGRTTQPSNSRSRRGSGASPQLGRPIRYSHEDPSRWDRDADPHAAWLDDVDRALAKKELARYAKFDREAQQSYSPSEYSQDSPVERQDRTSRSYSRHSIRSCHGEIVDPDSDLDATSDRGVYEAPAPAPAPAAPYKNPLEPDTCGTNHDVRRWDDVNNDARHQVTRVPFTPRKAPSPARAEVATMKPPPRLKDRAYANVTPLVIPDRVQRQRRREPLTYQDEHHSFTSPISPIGVAKALPLPQESSSRRRTADMRREPDASVSQLADTLHNLNPLGQVRRGLQERDLADEVGSFHAVHAAQELRKQGYTDEVRRTSPQSAGS
ncbi:hypothetical protein GE09DRAFT_1184657, partial [Coniochaeta sp. 2T2.1]